MEKRRRYYLGRVHKIGQSGEERLIEAFDSPAIVHARDYAWTFTDVQVKRSGNKVLFVYAQLSKFHPQGTVRVIDEKHRTQGEKPEPNLLIAASPFVYLPQYSGIAYQHVWNQIERKAFVKRFADIVHESHRDFFLKCELEPITDLRTFAGRLAALDAFLEIQAKVHPPNPLFGRAWSHLKQYLEQRAAEEMSLKEKGNEDRPLRTEVVKHIQAVLDDPPSASDKPQEPLPVTDAAILMAADGYGSGKVTGKEAGSLVTIRTSETQKSFLFDAEPDAVALSDEASKHLSRINKQRNLGHE